MATKERSLHDLIITIQKKAKEKNHFVIALSGFGGAGKSVNAKKLAEALGNSVVIPLDAFILNRLVKRSKDWDGFDWTRLFEQVLKPIHNGKEVLEYGIYDWSKNKVVEEKTLQLPKYIIIEGCGLIREYLNKYFDFCVWINLSLETAAERGKVRDKGEYKVDHDKFWDEIWTPNDRDYFEKYQPATKADFLLKI